MENDGQWKNPSIEIYKIQLDGCVGNLVGDLLVSTWKVENPTRNLWKIEETPSHLSGNPIFFILFLSLYSYWC